MEVPTEAFELSIFLYNHIENRQVTGRLISGSLPVEYDFDYVLEILDNANILGMDNKDSRHIEFNLPHLEDGFFAKNLDELLENPSRRYQVPSRFYLSDIDFTYTSDLQHSQIPVEIQNYLSAVDLISSLQTIANYSYPEGGTLHLVFLDKRKLEFDVSYCSTDLMCLPRLPEFKEQFFESSIHSDQIETIFRTSLLEIFQDQGNDESIPIKELISRFPALHRKIKHGYQLYVSEFSFKKIKSQIEKEKVEFVSRLNKVFSDIQNQLLAVPAALILAGGQMENTGQWKEANVLIWLGCVVFAVFMTMLIRNQRITLEAVKNEISHQWDQIENEHQSVSDRFQEVYKLLNKRYRQQKWLLRFIDLTVAIVVASTTGLLLWYSATHDEISTFIDISLFLVVPLFIFHIFTEYASDFRAWILKIKNDS
jgi:uncharacterized membrane protein